MENKGPCFFWKNIIILETKETVELKKYGSCRKYKEEEVVAVEVGQREGETKVGQKHMSYSGNIHVPTCMIYI